MPDFTYRHNDLLLRFTGVLAIVIAVVALRQLYSLVHLPPHHEASLIELAWLQLVSSERVAEAHLLSSAVTSSTRSLSRDLGAAQLHTRSPPGAVSPSHQSSSLVLSRPASPLHR